MNRQELEHKLLFQDFMSECAELKSGAWTQLQYIVLAFMEFCVLRSVDANDVDGYTCDKDKRLALFGWMKEYNVRLTGCRAHPVAVGMQLVKWPCDKKLVIYR